MALGVLIMLFLFFWVVLLFVFWIWMLINCIRNDRISRDERLIWVIVIVFLNIIGAVLYYFFGRGHVEKKHLRAKRKKRA
ncbi:PLDc N-terminal domain-containing protein [Candidatus Woesearchaeota archaeon]|nr:PLDc N-terminal domain-containing protein [Candidatus Woesearchaeota archaeon]